MNEPGPIEARQTRLKFTMSTGEDVLTEWLASEEVKGSAPSVSEFYVSCLIVIRVLLQRSATAFRAPRLLASTWTQGTGRAQGLILESSSTNELISWPALEDGEQTTGELRWHNSPNKDTNCLCFPAGPDPPPSIQKSPTRLADHTVVTALPMRNKSLRQLNAAVDTVLFDGGRRALGRLALLAANGPYRSGSTAPKGKIAFVLRQMTSNPRCRSLVRCNLQRTGRGQRVQRIASTVARYLNWAVQVHGFLASMEDADHSPADAVAETQYTERN